MTEERARRKLSGIFSADAVGYSRLMAQDEAGTVSRLKKYRALMTDLVQQYRGRVVDSPGDNILSEFSSVIDATECAVKIQKELKKKNAELPDDVKMEFRIGINLGDVIVDGKRIYGDGVNVAARIEGLADAGGICISRTAFDQIKNKLDLGYKYLGEHAVKNITEPVRVYRVLMEPEAAGTVIGEKRNAKKRRVSAAAVVLIGAIGAVAVWYFYTHKSTRIEPASLDKMVYSLPDKPSIAVLPFDNLSGDPDQTYFCDGLSEEIITALSKVPELFVIARNSSFTYKGKPVKVQQVAQDLGVRYVLEGSVRKSRENLRVTAQLVDAIKGHHLWAERWDRELKDVFAIQDDITMKITTALQVELTKGERARIIAKGTNNLDAYLKALEANENVIRFNRENNELARQLAIKAIDIDPQYAFAYAILGKTHVFDVWLGTSRSPEESISQALKLAQKAIGIDESLGVAYALLGFLYTMTGQHEKGIAESEKAIALEPNSDLAHQALGLALRFGGRPNDAIPVIKKAIRLNPFTPSTYIFNLGLAYVFTGQYEEAVAECKKATTREPDNLGAQLSLTVAYGLSGRNAEARDAAQEVLRINPKFSLDRFSRSLVYKNRADKDRFIDALRKAGLPDKPPLPLPDKPSIAVLAFDNLSKDPEQAYFSDGLTEEIITALSKTPKLLVIARNSTFTYKGRPVKVQQIGRELGVKYVLEGSVRKSEDSVRITAQLVDAQTGHHLWAERYDRDMKDIFAIQDEVTMKILTSLQVTLTEGESARSFEKGTNSLEAYLKTIEGRELMSRLNKDDNALARRKFEEVIALDPKFARAYAGLSFTYTLDFMFGVDPKESLRKAYECAQKAIALDEGQLLAHGALEFVYGWKRQHEMAVAAGERAVQVAPGCADAYFYLGRALNFACRDEEAVSQLEKAIRMNPFPPAFYYMHIGIAHFNLRQYEQAVSALKKALALNSKNISARRMLTVTYVEMGRLEEARVEAEEILKIDPKFTSKGMEKIVPFKDPEVVRRWVEALRTVGLERDI